MNALMNNVKVKQAELLTNLKINLKQHKIDVKEALEARHNEIEEYFIQAQETMSNNPSYQPKENINFPLPQDNSAEYSRAIRMVEMSVETIIELTEDQFDKLVMDNWHWKQDLIRTSAIYGKMM